MHVANYKILTVAFGLFHATSNYCSGDNVKVQIMFMIGRGSCQLVS